GHWNGPGAGVASTYPGSAGYPVSTDNVSSPIPAVLPAVDGNDKDARKEIIARTRAILAGDRNLFIDRSEVYAKAVQEHDPGYVLVSLQRPEDYADGHVPGAIDIPPADLAKPESLGRLPRDRKIVLACYIGHWGGSAALFLNQLGYEAYDMRFGTLGWNDGTEGLGGAKEYLQSLGKSLDLPVEKGTGK
ncbi:MAG TPA: rhodanese-like domain-containing protein, partial [Candidatus Deferrimicrobiaceae bacterium]